MITAPAHLLAHDPAATGPRRAEPVRPPPASGARPGSPPRPPAAAAEPDPADSALRRAAGAGLISAGALDRLIASMGGGARPSARGSYVDLRV